MKKVRWGIIGPGKIAHQFANDIRFTSNSEIVAVASNSAQRAQEFAGKYGIPTAYDNYPALYEASNVDMIYVATTHNFHFENSRDAIINGKAVLCEKPITDNLASAVELFEIARKNKVYLMEALWTYFLPAIQKAKEWINEGRIGKVINLKADFGFRKEFDPESRLYNPKLSGGVLLDMGIYPVAMSWYFLQQKPDQYNVVMTKAPTGVDYDINLQLMYPDITANLHSSYRAKLSNYAYIVGEEGYIVLPDFWRASECFLYQGGKIIDQFNDHRKGLGFEFEIEAAANDWQNGKTESAIMPPANSIALQELMGEIAAHF